MKIEQQNQILGCMNDVLNQNGFRAEIMQKDGAPTILRCEAMRQGKVAKDVVIEACFIPMQLPAEDMGLLQFFVTLFQSARKQQGAAFVMHAITATTSVRSVRSALRRPVRFYPSTTHWWTAFRTRENHSVCKRITFPF